MPIVIAVAAPLLAALGYAVAGRNRFTGWLGGLAGLAVGVTGAAAVAGRINGTDPWTGGGLIVLGGVATILLATLPGQLDAALADRWIGPRTVRAYGIGCGLLVAGFAVALVSPGPAGSWCAMALVTGLSVVLIGQRDRSAARWLAAGCGTGLAVAAAGLLVRSVTTVDTAADRLGAVAIALGLAAGLGAVPLHAWPARVHQAAAAPVSALVTGGFGAVTGSLLFRLTAGPGTGWSAPVVAALGAAGLVLGGAGLVRATDHRRLTSCLGLATASIPLLAAAAGNPGRTLILLAAWAWPLTVLRLANGPVLAMTGSSRIDTVRALWRRRPAVGSAALIALLGMAFGPAATLLRFGWPAAEYRPWLLIACAGSAGAVAVGLARWARMLWSPDRHPHLTTGPGPRAGLSGYVLPAGAALALVAVLTPLPPGW